MKLHLQGLVRASTVSLGAALTLWVASPAVSATITHNMTVEFSGGTAPAGPTPWVTATFDDSFGGPNTVRLTVTNTNLTGGESGEFTAGIYLNFDSSLDASLLTFAVVDNSASTPNSVTGSNNSFMADGDGFFDILFDMPPPPGLPAGRFTGGESIVYDLTYTSAITAGSFNFPSELGGGAGTFLAAAHVQNTEGGESGWVGAVPEPGTAVMLGIGLVGLALQGRRRRQASL